MAADDRWHGAGLSTGVIRDRAGNLYGTASTGGISYMGVVFKIDTRGNYTVLHEFSGNDGGSPNGLVSDTEGNLYGIAQGTYNVGPMLYKLDRAGRESIIYSSNFGGTPNPIIRDLVGNFNGTAYGNIDYGGYGVLYKVDSAGNYSLLYNFYPPGGSRTDYPRASN